MKLIYTARNLADAHIFKGVLESYGIPCRIKGEELFNIRGEVPLTQDTLPTVWIEHKIDYLKAMKIKEEYERNASESHGSGEKWACTSCGELHEGQFTECWNCGKSRNGKV